MAFNYIDLNFRFKSRWNTKGCNFAHEDQPVAQLNTTDTFIAFECDLLSLWRCCLADVMVFRVMTTKIHLTRKCAYWWPFSHWSPRKVHEDRQVGAIRGNGGEIWWHIQSFRHFQASPRELQPTPLADGEFKLAPVRSISKPWTMNPTQKTRRCVLFAHSTVTPPVIDIPLDFFLPTKCREPRAKKIHDF